MNSPLGRILVNGSARLSMRGDGASPSGAKPELAPWCVGVLLILIASRRGIFFMNFDVSRSSDR